MENGKNTKNDNLRQLHELVCDLEQSNPNAEELKELNYVLSDIERLALSEKGKTKSIFNKDEIIKMYETFCDKLLKIVRLRT